MLRDRERERHVRSDERELEEPGGHAPPGASAARAGLASATVAPLSCDLQSEEVRERRTGRPRM